ncbi:MAG TPA: GspE/PulE family protein [Candidatus Paceibacterota bacterium]|nr:GspE/PulE family protein [Candidatus Paceibacterota bacterium]
MSFLDVLADKNIISPDEVLAIKEEAQGQDKSIDEVLQEKGVTPEQILQAKSEYMQIPVRNLGGQEIPFEILKYIPEESALHYKIIPLAVKDGVLEVGLVEPDNIEARDALNFISSKNNLPFKIFVVSEEDFERVLNSYKGLSGEVTKALTELEGELSAEEIEIEKIEKREKGGTKQANIIEDAPVTKIVATILRYALDGEASDVHIEAMREKVRVRFRVDGVLNTSLLLPMNVHSAVVARIKILSDMKLDEKRKPQDGRFSARIEGRKIDFRVSTFPAYYGEKIVMRILDQEKGVKKLGSEDMGLTPKNLELIRQAITRPYGLILITGPTGSGKSTTLYSMLNEIDKEESNVLSLEDPVEYNIEGVSQSQVRPEIGYTFANGLRTTLRQDPDVIMVGEIRDKETAALAIQAALTGHLVLSTLHTNTAVGAIPRLIDMGVDPYLIAPTLILTMAQRLVAKICPGGGKEIPVEGSIKVMIDRQFEDLPEKYKKDVPMSKTVLEAVPTEDCPRGTRGRVAVFEAFKMDKELEDAILKDPTELNLTKLLREKGMLTMKEDAMIKAFNKTIPFEEVNTL